MKLLGYLRSDLSGADEDEEYAEQYGQALEHDGRHGGRLAAGGGRRRRIDPRHWRSNAQLNVFSYSTRTIGISDTNFAIGSREHG